MASIKVIFRPSTVADREGSVFYQIIHRRQISRVSTGRHIYPWEWNEKRSMVGTARGSERGPLVRAVRKRVLRDVERLKKIVSGLDNEGVPYTADEVTERFLRYIREYSLFNFMEHTIATLRANGRTRTAETYRATLRSFRMFRNGEDMMLDDLDSEIMEKFESWHHARGNAANTISFYTRILRAVYNRAASSGGFENRMPFSGVYTGIARTAKRALPLRVIRRLRHIDLNGKPALEFARDMFMLSFYLRGMSFIDMAYLRKEDICGGYVVYRRRKTGRLMMVAWTREMQRILDKYPANPTRYLLPIFRKEGDDKSHKYRNMAYHINLHLKKLGKMLDADMTLTLYVARHSWASAAHSKGVPLSVISEGMGHDSESTTRIYLASLDSSIIDRANARLIRAVE